RSPPGARASASSSMCMTRAGGSPRRIGSEFLSGSNGATPPPTPASPRRVAQAWGSRSHAGPWACTAARSPSSTRREISARSFGSPCPPSPWFSDADGGACVRARAGRFGPLAKESSPQVPECGMPRRNEVHTVLGANSDLVFARAWHRLHPTPLGEENYVIHHTWVRESLL